MLDQATIDRLTALYTAPDRHYHSIRHIEDLLRLADAHGDLLHDRDAVAAAIWFHDAILDTRRKDNEERSASLAADWLGPTVAPDRLAAIEAMILATASHVVPTDLDADVRGDVAAMLDMDLSILGAAPDAFDAYEAQVRREYDWVPEDAWRGGRAAVLKGFLDRPAIFRTKRFHALYETQARANISRSLERLVGKTASTDPAESR